MVRVTYCASDLTLSQLPAKCGSSLVLILEVVVTEIFQDGYSKAKSWKREWAGIVSLVTHWLAQQGVLLSVLRFNRIHFNRAFPRLHTYCDRAAAPCLFKQVAWRSRVFAIAFSIQKQNMPSQRRCETVTLSLLTPVHGPPSARAVVLFLEVSATMLRLSVGKDG